MLNESIKTIWRAEVLGNVVGCRLICEMVMWTRTGIPQEHEMPAPVRTMILLHFDTANERGAEELMSRAMVIIET